MCNRRQGRLIMRRETKIGLVVACAFVGLTAVVVYVKMNQGAVSSGGDTQQNTQQAKNTAKGPDAASPFVRTSQAEFVGPISEQPNFLPATNASELTPPGIVSIGTAPNEQTLPPGLQSSNPPLPTEPPKTTVTVEPFEVRQLPGHPDSSPPAIVPPGAPTEVAIPSAPKAEANIAELPPSVTAPPAPIAIGNQNTGVNKLPGALEQPPAVSPA